MKVKNYVPNGTSILFLISTLLLHIQAEPCLVYKYPRSSIAEGAPCFSLSSFLKQQFPKYQSRENYVVNFPLTSIMNRILR